jgi:hypothetical protein
VRPARRLARLVGRLLGPVYPASQSSWTQAMRFEIEQIEGDGAALRFALGCLWGGCREAARQRFSAIAGGDAIMSVEFAKLRQPRHVGIACALAATCLGLFYLAAAGAPLLYLVVNSAALLLGLVALGGIAAAAPGERLAGAAIVALGLCLLATAWFGASSEGASRWIPVGPLYVQLSLVVLPAMIVAFARRADVVGALGIAVAALALALQPDRAMAGVLALATAALAVARPGRSASAAALAAAAAFAAALLRPDSLPAVPYVDRILFTAFEVHVLAGAAIAIGAILLLVPPVVGWIADPARRPVYLAFGAAWLGCLIAAALGNYPTPVVGYGGSAILGYLLSLSLLPAGAGAAAARAGSAAAEGDADRHPGLSKQALPA